MTSAKATDACHHSSFAIRHSSLVTDPATQQTADLVNQSGAVLVAAGRQQLQRATQPPVQPQLLQPDVGQEQVAPPLSPLGLAGRLPWRAW